MIILRTSLQTFGADVTQRKLMAAIVNPHDGTGVTRRSLCCKVNLREFLYITAKIGMSRTDKQKLHRIDCAMASVSPS